MPQNRHSPLPLVYKTTASPSPSLDSHCAPTPPPDSPACPEPPHGSQQRRMEGNPNFVMRGDGEECCWFRPSPSSISLGTSSPNLQLPNPTSPLTQGRQTVEPWERRAEHLHWACAGHLPGSQADRPTPLRARPVTLRRLVASPASERHPRWAPAPCLTAARVCPGPALLEEGDDRGPSIKTWSDGPGLSIPLRRLEALTSRPGSAAVWAPRHVQRTQVGRHRIGPDPV
jgi:hypothetical protein